MTRDFVGYGSEPPHARWPGDARIAVNFVINFEEGSELSYPAGDGVSEGGLTEMLGTDLGVRGRDLAAESMFEYGAGRFLAPPPHIHPLQGSGDDLRLRQGV